MSDAVKAGEAWLEWAQDSRLPLKASCSIGRAPSNAIVLDEPKVSRRHALIHQQGADEHWLVDLGSRNGTYLNGKRVIQPTRLQDKDRISIGDTQFAFRHLNSRAATQGGAVDMTVTEIRRGHRWLLLADVVGSTQISRRLPSNDLSMLLGQWLAACKEIIDRNEGAINKFLGDGFLAYWPNETTPEAIAQTLKELRERQDHCEPSFRVVVHYGELAMGGASLGEESLLGSAVNKVFRMEKLAGSIGESRMMSADAYAQLSGQIDAAQIGQHELPGFATKEVFYAFLAETQPQLG